MKKLSDNKATIFTKINKIYFAVMSIMVIVASLFVYSAFSKVFKDEIKLLQQTYNEQVSTNMDDKLSGMYMNFYSLLNSNDDMKNFFSILKTEPDYMQYYEIQKKLRNFMAYDSAISSVYMYSKATNHVVTNYVSSDLDTFADKETIEKVLERNDFYNSLQQINEESDCVSLALPFPMNGFYSNLGVVLINIDKDIFTRLETKEKNMEIAILDQYGNYIMVSDEAKKIVNKISSESEEGYVKSGKTYAFYSTSDFFKWKYIYITEKNYIFSTLHGMVLSMLLIILLMTLVAYIVNKILNKYLHQPIELLLKNITSKLLSEDKMIDFDQISGKVSDYVDQQAQMEKNIKKSLPIMKWGLVMDIIMGKRTDYESVESSLNVLGAEASKNNFIVMSVRIASGNSEKKNSMLNSWNAEELISRSLGYYVKNICIKLENNFVAILNFETSDEVKCYDIAKKCAENVIKTVNSEAAFLCSIGIGRYYKDFSNISKSYVESEKALKYRFVYPVNSLIFYNDVSEIYGDFSFDTQFDNIRESFKNENFEDIKLNLKKIFDLVKSSRMYDSDDIYRIVIQLVEIAVQESVKIGLTREVFLGRINLHSDISTILKQYESIDEVCMFVEDFYECGIGTMKAQKEKLQETGNLIDEIVRYIHENYDNPDLSLEMLADLFHYNVSYLSSSLKNKIGHTFTEHLISLRIEKSKVLLKSTSVPVAKVSEMVGYTNYHGFAKMFKKIVGVSPSAYRKMNMFT